MARYRTNQAWSNRHMGGAVIRGELVRVIDGGETYPFLRTHVIRLDEPYFGFETLSFDPDDLEPDDERALAVRDVWPDADASGLRDEVRRQWPQLADALDRECGLA